MSELNCPFSVIQASGACHCQHAQEVVRRGGSEFLCRENEANVLCIRLKDHLNTIALPALGYEDDLTQTPKSVYERILICGLQGLRIAQDPNDSGMETNNIWVVVDATHQKYPSVSDIPQADFVPAIEACKLKKRRRKRL
ncbi:MAG: hypothetical protein EP297_10160 [Gammaproteobacteria bacterium]|nr:MAG: hypothetical protein EP297_10160 [Gammaproteobacteria bacterium]